jgi:biotin carboxyl carrier protein
VGDTHTGFLQDTGLLEPIKETIPVEVLVAAVLGDDGKAEEASDPFALFWRDSGTERRFHFDVGGTHHIVAVRRDGGGTLAKVGDRSLPVEVVARRGVGLTLRFGEQQERFFVARVPATSYVQWRGRHYRLAHSVGLSVDTLQLDGGGAGGHASLEAPMSGTIAKVFVREGQAVGAGEPLLVLEAMKMEHTIAAPHAGVVTRLPYTAGQLVLGGATLVELDAQQTAA